MRLQLHDEKVITVRSIPWDTIRAINMCLVGPALLVMHSCYSLWGLLYIDTDQSTIDRYVAYSFIHKDYYTRTSTYKAHMKP